MKLRCIPHPPADSCTMLVHAPGQTKPVHSLSGFKGSRYPWPTGACSNDPLGQPENAFYRPRGSHAPSPNVLRADALHRKPKHKCLRSKDSRAPVPNEERSGAPSLPPCCTSRRPTGTPFPLPTGEHPSGRKGRPGRRSIRPMRSLRPSPVRALGRLHDTLRAHMLLRSRGNHCCWPTGPRSSALHGQPNRSSSPPKGTRSLERTGVDQACPF